MPAPDFDINAPSPDDGHESIRVAVVGAIEELDYNTDDVGSSFGLIDTAFELLSGALATIDALTDRMAALEAAVPPIDPTPEVAP